MKMRQILVTSALPYANGDIHIGHLVEYIQTDIWVRFQKMRGHTVHYICADDAHGTPIMLRAEKENVSPETLIQHYLTAHTQDFADFFIGFDQYYSTHSPENKALSEALYLGLKKADKIAIKTIKQLFDPVKQMFLPDRFVKGECPKCHAKDQYGDNCEVCGATYAPTDLISPYSVVSGAQPILKETEHYFFKLSECQDFLTTWLKEDRLQVEAMNKMMEWLGEGKQLEDWDISRDAPYFGFEIPSAPGKFFYVWLDAPIGYMASFQKLAEKNGLDFAHYWGEQAKTELYHFIGKDILYFHALFWPSILAFSGHRTPTKIFVHGFLTVNGEKMSKSRGTFITARHYLETIGNPEYLRYYYAAKLNGSMEDIDFNLDDFMARVNSDLIGKYLNIASRTASFIHKFFDGQLNSNIREDVIGIIRDAEKDIAMSYENRDTNRVLREVMRLADFVNGFIAEAEPWKLAKDETPSARRTLHQDCSTALSAFRLLSLYLKPILPHLVLQVESFLNIPPLTWGDVYRMWPLPAGMSIALEGAEGLSEDLLNYRTKPHQIQPYQHLGKRIEKEQMEGLVSAEHIQTKS